MLLHVDTFQGRNIYAHPDHPEWGQFMVPEDDGELAKFTRALEADIEYLADEAWKARSRAIALDREAKNTRKRVQWLNETYGIEDAS